MRLLLPAAIAISLISALGEATSLAAEDRRSPPQSTAPAFVSALRRSVDLQLDPTPFFLKGFAPELGLSLESHRVFATVVAYDVPAFLREDRSFEERRDYILGVGYQYFPLGHVDGPFVGLGVTLTHTTFTRSETGHEATTFTFRPTARVGWAVYPLAALPDLFLGPWLGAWYSVRPEQVSIDGTPVERKRLGITGAIQLGWRL